MAGIRQLEFEDFFQIPGAKQTGRTIPELREPSGNGVAERLAQTYSRAMKQAAKSRGPRQNSWWTRKRVICLALVVLATIYVLLQPKLEQWTGMELPDLVERDAPAAAAPENSGSDPNRPEGNRGDRQASELPSSGPGNKGFRLQSTGPRTWQSPAGLIYTMGPGGQHRIDHVMRHASDDPDRNVHGVFDADEQDDVLALLDEAYGLIQAGSERVRRQPSDDGRTEYTIEMSGRIGYVGGRSGARQGHPQTNRLNLILDGQRVITAYPSWPRRR
jgi:hypothetical protein